MSWPEYLQGYAGLGILQTLSSLLRAAMVAGGGSEGGVGADAPVNRGKGTGGGRASPR